MSLSRRALFRSLGGGVSSVAAPHIAARGREALEAERWPHGLESEAPPPSPEEIQINSNENPLGPGPNAMAALEGSFVNAGRYPMNATGARPGAWPT